MWLLFGGQIAKRDDADRLTIFYHWQATDGFITHQTHHFIDGV